MGGMTHTTHGAEHSADDNSPEAWNALYEEKPAVWSGAPNAQLVEEVSDLAPGKALDVGCGEGADAVWLAQRGWQVTATDISSVALDRAREHAAAVADVTFVQVDLVEEPPSPGTYDLVSAQFFQIIDPPRSRFMRSLGEAVAPRGHLLIVGHHPDGTLAPSGRHRDPDRFYTPDEITSLFPAEEWQVEVAEARERTAMHHGELTDLVDAVVVLRRR